MLSASRQLQAGRRCRQAAVTHVTAFHQGLSQARWPSHASVPSGLPEKGTVWVVWFLLLITLFFEDEVECGWFERSCGFESNIA